MASLETRVEKLESTVGGDTPIIRTIIHFVRPGELDAPIAIVRAASGRLYPAKDAHMSGNDFRAAYPQWEQLERLRDPSILSRFWKRVTE